MRNVHRVHVTDIWSWYRLELRVGDHLGRSEELVSRCVECDLAEPESLASLGGSAPGVVDGILSFPQAPVERPVYKDIPCGFEMAGGSSKMDYALLLHGNVYGQNKLLTYGTNT